MRISDWSSDVCSSDLAAVTLDGIVAAVDERYALTTLEVSGGTLVVPGRRGAPGDLRRLRIRASDVSFTRVPPAETTILNCLPARIRTISGQGGDDAQVNVVVGLGPGGEGASIAARITRRSLEALELTPGTPVYAQIKSVALVAAWHGPAESGRR